MVCYPGAQLQNTWLKILELKVLTLRLALDEENGIKTQAI